MPPPKVPDRHRPFGGDRFGVLAERFARFFGTPKFIISQTVIILIWIAPNAAVVAFRWDPYPFILLNLVFSTQAAYAAPVILLAQTRQADRDHIRDMAAHEDKSGKPNAPGLSKPKRRCLHKTSSAPSNTLECLSRTRRLHARSLD